MNGPSQPMGLNQFSIHNYDKTLGYFQTFDGKHVVFGNVINGLTLYTKLKLKGCKVNMSRNIIVVNIGEISLWLVVVFI